MKIEPNSMGANMDTLPEGFKETELGLLPKEWEVVRLRDVAEKMKAGGTPKRGIKEYWNGEIPFVLIEDMTSCRLYLPKTKETITKEGLKNSSAWLVPENSLLLSMYATIGETAINTIPVATNQAILAIITKSNFDNVFGAYLLKFNAERLKMQNIQSTQKNVNKGIVENFKIPLPPLSEQKKIAFVLSTVREAKEKTEDVIKATKELKKSMMKHLFTYGPVPVEEAKNVPLKETEIGQVPEDWEVVRLGDIFNIYAGGDVSKINYSSVKTDKYIYPIYSNSKENNGLYGFSDTYKFPENSITVTGRGNLGYATPRFEKFNAIIRLLVLIPKSDMQIRFFSEFINANIRVNLEGSSIPQLTKPKISSYFIPLPSLPIQQKIASILSAIDQKIEAEESKKKALEELFKSMLHNLMTAKVRVNNLEV